MTRSPWHLVGAAALTIAAVGFVTGTRPEPPPRAPGPSGAPAAPGYGDLRLARRGLNADMYKGAWEALHQGGPALFDPVVQTEEDRRRALERRSERRAYDGAPPSIPHSIEQMRASNCLTCHLKGARIADKVAPRPSHPLYASCTQCHATMADPRPVRETPVAPETSFVGLRAPERGERAWPGAPPTIPHSTWMRSECSSCHGTGGALGMRTTHPSRQICTQCHAPSAALDQHEAIR
jgi:cytochrome c-type protein NapB